jgi:hypothetical protein
MRQYRLADRPLGIAHVRRVAALAPRLIPTGQQYNGTQGSWYRAGFGAHAASGHDIVLVCGQLAPASRSSEFQVCGHLTLTNRTDLSACTRRKSGTCRRAVPATRACSRNGCAAIAVTSRRPEQPRKLQAALVDHVPAHCRGPEIPRVVGLAAGTARLPPRNRGDHLPPLHLAQREAGLAAISHAQRHHRIRGRPASRPDASHGR